MIDNQLKGSCNTDMVTKKCNQRLHFLRIINNVHVDKGIISLFYKSTVESMINYSVIAWYGKLTCKDKNKLGRIVKKAKNLGAETKAIDTLRCDEAGKKVNERCKPSPVQSVCIPKVRKKATLAHTTHRRV